MLWIALALVWFPATALAQTPASYPGEGITSPIPPSRIAQMRDDEIGVLLAPRPSSIVNNVAFEARGMFFLPQSSTALAPSPSPLLNPHANDEVPLFIHDQIQQQGFAVGRFVDPTRDTVVVLGKVGFDENAGSWVWKLAEHHSQPWQDPFLPFSPANPGQIGPTGVPSLTVTRPFVPNEGSNFALGAIAAGDLDRLVDAKGAFHDEIAMVTQDWPIFDNDDLGGLTLSVVSYADVPGQASIRASVPLPNPYSYLPMADAADPAYPAPIAVTIGDFDGDGKNEIAVVTTTFDPTNVTHSLQLFLYRYDPGDSGGRSPGLALSQTLTLDSGPSGKVFRNPLSIARGDLDGDGKEELLVLSLTNVHTISGGIPGADLLLTAIEWDAASRQLVVVNTEKPTDRAEPWQDNGKVTDHHANYLDHAVVTGQFSFDGTASFPLSMRSAAIAYHEQGHDAFFVETWNFAKHPDGTWTAARADHVAVPNCGGENAWFDLAAGNWQGVHAQAGVPSLWGLAVTYETRDPAGTPVQAVLLGSVDGATQKIDFGTPRLLPSNTEPAGTCGAIPFFAHIFPLDIDGDSLMLGPPIHLVLSQVRHYDYVLQEPPKHIDYRPDLASAGAAANGILNVSRFKDFRFGYANTDKSITQTTSSKSTTFNTGGGVTADVRGTFGENIASLVEDQFSVDFTFKLGGDHQGNQSSYTGQQRTYVSQLDQGASTADALAYQTTTTDIWRYLLYGTTAVVPDDPGAKFAYYELTVPRAVCDASDSDDGQSCPTNVVDGNVADGYQPWHINGNLLSYPACGDSGCSAAVVPADLGGWRRPTPATADEFDTACRFDSGGGKTSGCTCVPDAQDPNGTEVCQTAISKPVSYTWPNQATQTISLDQTVQSGSSRSWSNDVYFSTDFAVGYRYGGGPEGNVQGCFDLHYGLKKTWSGSSGRSVTSENDLSFTLNVPSAGPQSISYTFQPTLYAAGGQPLPNKPDDTPPADNPPRVGSTMKLAHTVGIDATDPFWAAAYKNADPALNLPHAFDTTDGGSTWVLNPADDAKQLRGFLTLNGNAKANGYRQPLPGPAKVGDAVLANQVLLQVHVYNLSVGSSVSNIPVRFDLVQFDPATGLECADPTKCVTRRVLPSSPGNPNPSRAICYNPYSLDAGKANPQNCDGSNSPTLPARGLGLAEYTVDISQLGPPDGSSQAQYRIYVVVDPDATIEQTHGWRQPRVVLRPRNPEEGDIFTVQIFQGQALANPPSVSFTSQGALSDVLPGLVTALKNHPAIKQNNVSVTCQFPSSTLQVPPPCERNDATLVDGKPQIVISPPFGTDARSQLEPSTEFRAGFLTRSGDQTSGFYFVPLVQGGCVDTASCPEFAATSDLPGQNNEGWGVLTVLAPSATLVGDSPIDPCRKSSLDLFLTPESLAAVDLDRAIRSDVVRARPSQPLRVRFTGFATDHTFGFESAQLFLGHPGAPTSTLLADRFVHGIDRDQGGTVWFNWRTPSTPGIYTLYGQLAEPTSDPQPGNNLAKLEVVVADEGSQIVGTVGRGLGRPGRGHAHIAGTRPIVGAFDAASAQVTIWNALNEAGAAGELARADGGGDPFPLTLVGTKDANGQLTVFETPAGVSPHVRLKLDTHTVKKVSLLDFSLQIDGATIPKPALCTGTPQTTDLVTTVSIDGGGAAPIVIDERRPWQCFANSLRTAP